MTTNVETPDRRPEDPVSNVLKWVLLIVAVACFAVLGWTTDLTYQDAPPLPDRFVTADGTLVLSSADIQAGKAGFQKADLMDYGSLYGMGSYFGEDYTAANLVRLATLTEDNIAKAKIRQSAGGFAGGGASVGHGSDAGRAARHRSHQAGRDPSRRRCRRDHDAARRDRAVAAASRLRQGLDAGLQPRSANRARRPRIS